MRPDFCFLVAQIEKFLIAFITAVGEATFTRRFL
jgi:hypothetical protein